jgi:hypothetical protein
VALAFLLAGCAHDPAFFVPPGPPAQSAPAAPTDAGAPAPDAADDAPDPTAGAELPPDTAALPDTLSETSPLTAAPAPAGFSPAVWGIVGARGYPYGDNIASNGQEFKQLFSVDLNFNIWLWRAHGLYLYTDTRFWGQKPGAGVTNPSQGVFDFSKREFDFNAGAAWNFAGNWEARAFAYSFNNLNRGSSQVSPTGFNDGVGLEQRYYLGPAYAALGTPAFDQARATFLGAGYYPTKTMEDNSGQRFKPGPFARAYLTWGLRGEWLYLYTDDQLIGERTLRPKLFLLDSGVAVRPFVSLPRLELRVGTEDNFDLQHHDTEVSVYGSVRYVY